MGIMAPTIGWPLGKLRKLEKTLDAKQQYEFCLAVLQARRARAALAALGASPQLDALASTQRLVCDWVRATSR